MVVKAVAFTAVRAFGVYLLLDSI